MERLYRYFIVAAILFLLPSVSCGCSNENTPDVTPENILDVDFTVPASIDISKDGESYEFMVRGGKAPMSSDVIILESSSGVGQTYPIESVGSDKFAVRFPADMQPGEYRIYIKRGSGKKLIGKTQINVVERLDVDLDKATTVYGLVSTADGPVAGVVVSDGIEVTTTDEKGIYQLKSAKKRGYVFMTIPGGYEANLEGVFPQFYKRLLGNASYVERADFTLTKVNDQDNYKLLAFGDIHLAKRTSDLNQFADFADDVNKYRQSHAGEKFYAVTLGDMTWELYWESNKYGIPEYMNTVNSQLKGLPMFHTMGNHDNDMTATSDFSAEIKYQQLLAPVYYSFNIGKVHYIVLDDIDCSLYDGTKDRNYQTRISEEQLSWLAKDLAYVSKNTPLIIMAHAPLTSPDLKGNFTLRRDADNTRRLFDILDGYKVNVLSGHTHVNYNATTSSPVWEGHDFFEHNVAAVCASWWWSGHLTEGVSVSLDGSPGGYAIWDIKGDDMKWIYKATGHTEDYQFRAYDLNNISFPMSNEYHSSFQPYADAYPANSNNEVLINVWNWSPLWEITVVTSSGDKLPVVQTSAYDPLHIAALTEKRCKGANSKPSFITNKSHHFFKVKAPDADTDLTITVKDEFGHEWTERMQRPKTFSTDEYKN